MDYVGIRAEYYARVKGKSVYEVILEWWQSDKVNPRWCASRQPPSADNKADEYQEWFDELIEKSFGDSS